MPTPETDPPMAQELLFTKDEWDAAMPLVAEATTSHLKPYRAPVFEHLEDHCEGWGSGSYLQLANRIFILTNAHV
jgi:hypothetical protein